MGGKAGAGRPAAWGGSIGAGVFGSSAGVSVLGDAAGVLASAVLGVGAGATGVSGRAASPVGSAGGGGAPKGLSRRGLTLICRGFGCMVRVPKYPGEESSLFVSVADGALDVVGLDLVTSVEGGAATAGKAEAPVIFGSWTASSLRAGGPRGAAGVEAGSADTGVANAVCASGGSNTTCIRLPCRATE